jgi:hypothetical protein
VEDPEDLRALMQRILGGNFRGLQYYHPVRSRRK